MKDYKGKPVIIGNVPWHRHHIFPWGWYQLGNIAEELTGSINISGYWHPADGYSNTYEIVDVGTKKDDGGIFIDLDMGIQAKGLFSDDVDIRRFGAIKDEDK